MHPLEKYRLENGLTQKELAEIIKVDKGNLSKIISGKSGISADVAFRIKSAIGIDIAVDKVVKKSVNRMLSSNDNVAANFEKQETKHTQPRLEAKPISLADPEGEHRTGEKIYELPDGQKVMEVKIVPAKGQAGYRLGYPDPEYYDDLPTLTIHVNGNHTGTYLAFEVKGDSMTPTHIEDMADAILEGWFVVGRELPKQHWKSKLHTHSHSYWVIVHKTEGILIKNISKHDVENGIITIHSLNEAYEDEELELKDIEQIFSGIKRIVNDR